MATPDHKPDHAELTQGHPDNVYFGGDVISWEYEMPEGTRATLGIVQPGFEETFPVAEGGERIRLYDPDSQQRLHIREIRDDKVFNVHILRQGTNRAVMVPEGSEIQISTPEGQEPVAYICEYPGQQVAE